MHGDSGRITNSEYTSTTDLLRVEPRETEHPNMPFRGTSCASCGNGLQTSLPWLLVFFGLRQFNCRLYLDCLYYSIIVYNNYSYSLYYSLYYYSLYYSIIVIYSLSIWISYNNSPGPDYFRMTEVAEGQEGQAVKPWWFLSEIHPGELLINSD